MIERTVTAVLAAAIYECADAQLCPSYAITHIRKAIYLLREAEKIATDMDPELALDFDSIGNRIPEVIE